MATSVKLAEHDKQRLDRLQGELTARHGRKVAQQDLMSWLLDLGEAEKARYSRDALRPMTSQEITALRHLAVRTGSRTREEDIDATVARNAK
ncbi:MAG: hypothetical protein L3K14_00665 [Thermoplasmata archaeon]|nr:hypothetical protein [Thermoplasmata archaeon]